MHEQPLPFTVHLSQKTKDLEGIPPLGGQFEYSSSGVYKTPPGEAQMGKTTK